MMRGVIKRVLLHAGYSALGVGVIMLATLLAAAASAIIAVLWRFYIEIYFILVNRAILTMMLVVVGWMVGRGISAMWKKDRQ